MYTNLFELIIDARQHIIDNKSSILVCDNPLKLWIGFSDGNSCFSIRLSHIKNRKAFQPIYGINDDAIKLLTPLVRCTAGRKTIANFINKSTRSNSFSDYINRIIKLKAFW